MVERQSLLGPDRGHQRTGFWWGLLSLAILTAIWGYCNIVIRQLELLSINPALLLMIRYLSVGLIGLPWFVWGPRLPLKKGLAGLAVGILLASATLSQALAMESIPVDNVAFITALYVVFTPLFMALFRRERPHRLVALAVLGSMLGVALLVGHLTLSIAAGTFWSLLAALFATAQIIGTSELSQSMTTIQLTIIEALGAGLTLCGYLLIVSRFQPQVLAWSWHAPLGVWWRLGFLALLGTLVAGWLQVFGQRQLTATQAALAFNMEPVWTLVFAWLALNQFLTWVKLLGATLIIASLMALSTEKSPPFIVNQDDDNAPYREH